jgi:hypothetical protein
MLKVANSETEKPAAPLASREKQTPETETRIAIVSMLNILVDDPVRENSTSLPWTYCGPPDRLLALMKARYTSPGLPDDANTLAKWCQSNYRLLREKGLLVSFPKHPQSGPDRPLPDLIKVERETNKEQYVPLIDGVRR